MQRWNQALTSLNFGTCIQAGGKNNMTKYFTSAGDDGTTGLLGEGRVKKYDLRMEALGTLDELSAALGIARSVSLKDSADEIKAIQVNLYKIMAEVAATHDQQPKFRQITSREIENLEDQIRRFSDGLADLKGFILPGDTTVSAHISLARAIARRAERRVAELLGKKVIENDQLLRFLNRLSSLLFVMELREIAESDDGDLSLAKDPGK
jgi:cob(I)alamin adenosyltransferase